MTTRLHRGDGTKYPGRWTEYVRADMLERDGERPDVDALQSECCEWTFATFGTPEQRGPFGPLDHLRKEIDEILADPSDVVEFVDAYMLLQDATARAGHRMSDVIAGVRPKLAINKQRKWPPFNPDASGAVEHIREQPGLITPCPECGAGEEVSDE
jgi:hypothetical protein